jgi:hypothetical protein
VWHSTQPKLLDYVNTRPIFLSKTIIKCVWDIFIEEWINFLYTKLYNKECLKNEIYQPDTIIW